MMMMDDYKNSDNFQRTEGCKMISPHHSHPTNGVSNCIFLNTENCLIFASAEEEDSERKGRSGKLGVRSLEKCEMCTILVSFIDGFCGALSITRPKMRILCGTF